MIERDCYYNLGWSDFFVEIQKFGKDYIDPEFLTDFQNKYGEGHAIVKRIINLPEWLANGLPIKADFLQIFGCRPNLIAMTHKDGIDRKCALNIPIANCDSGYLQWFDINLGEKLIVNKYTHIRLTEEEYADRSIRLQLQSTVETLTDQPCIVNTDLWHRINNSQNNNYRWMASIRFANNPPYKDVIESFTKILA